MDARLETFTVLINKISRSIRKVKNHVMTEYGLRSTHVSCLYYLYSADSLTATELCERCEEDKATISRALSFLEKNGFIVSGSKTTKRYKRPLCLTSLGKEVGKKLFDRVNLVLDEVSVGLTNAQRTTCYHYLSIVSENLETATEHLT